MSRTSRRDIHESVIASKSPLFSRLYNLHTDAICPLADSMIGAVVVAMTEPYYEQFIKPHIETDDSENIAGVIDEDIAHQELKANKNDSTMPTNGFDFSPNPDDIREQLFANCDETVVFGLLTYVDERVTLDDKKVDVMA